MTVSLGTILFLNIMGIEGRFFYILFGVVCYSFFLPVLEQWAEKVHRRATGLRHREPDK